MKLANRLFFLCVVFFFIGLTGIGLLIKEPNNFNFFILALGLPLALFLGTAAKSIQDDYLERSIPEDTVNLSGK